MRIAAVSQRLCLIEAGGAIDVHPASATAGIRHRAELQRSRRRVGVRQAGHRPPVFTKFPSCITGPYGEITLPPGGHTDWEVELVVVIAQTAHAVSRDSAWDYVAGLSAGQDISERTLQLAATPPHCPAT
jgi:2-keto-4-pentenoate hydratase/2-oxohepta-3-ene-1,7-dioic acid hydratase in catechol pathway